jgi:DNA-binding XRE family transcriptional regulator
MFTGDHLKEFRRRYGLTQRELAAFVRVKEREVRRWERGDVAMPLLRRLALARLMWTKVREQRQVPMQPCTLCCGAGRIPLNDRMNDRGT